MEYEREEEREATLHTFRSSFFVKQLRLNTGRNLETRGVSEGGGGALFLEMGFYANIWESRCNIEMHVWAHFLKILFVFEVPY